MKVGDIVYPAYGPQKVGVIIEIKQLPARPSVCRSIQPMVPGLGAGAVLLRPRCQQDSGHLGDHHGRHPVCGEVATWPNVENLPVEMFTPFPTYVIRTPAGRQYETGNVALYQSLIDDHRKKLATHEAAMAKVEAFRATL